MNFVYNEDKEGVTVIKPTEFITTTACIIVILILMILNIMFVFVRVQGFSMEPTYSSGDLILGRRYKTFHDEVNVGDIIIYKHDNDIVVHRVYEINDDGTFVTKGDAFESEDSYSTSIENVVGVIENK